MRRLSSLAAQIPGGSATDGNPFSQGDQRRGGFMASKQTAVAASSFLTEKHRNHAFRGPGSNQGLGFKARHSQHQRGLGLRRQALRINAIQERTRLADLVKSVPDRLGIYFQSPFRRALFTGIALFGGFYSAQTISLSFGAIGVNDVVASALCMLSTEYVTRFYHSQLKPRFPAFLLNIFKMGFIYGLFVDAFKLAS